MKASEAKDLYGWLVCMVADGWAPKHSGDGQFLYLEKDGHFYKGPVIADSLAVSLFMLPYFTDDVQKELISRGSG